MDRISELFQKYYNKEDTLPEREELMLLLSVAPVNVLESLVQKTGLGLNEIDQILNNEQEEKILKNILTDYRIKTPVSSRRTHYFKKEWFRYAAVVILALTTGAYLWLQNGQKQVLKSGNKYLQEEITPGKEGAILTLADGRQIVLDSMGNGIIATQQGTQIVLQHGQLSYSPAGQPGMAVIYNTMSTPKGRQFGLQLPDGTRVWLNAASTLRYPTQFNGAERWVEITGEAYFEVAQKAKQPFFVRINKRAEVEVLGTSFNVNAYENENTINTTLLDGAVRVNLLSPRANTKDTSETRDEKSVILQPGQQAELSGIDMLTHYQVASSTGIIKVTNADVDKVMAWKDGAFNLEGADLPGVMRQLERWYDLEVVYEGQVPDILFTGKMSRELRLSTVLEALKKWQINFRMEEGRRLVVMP